MQPHLLSLQQQLNISTKNYIFRQLNLKHMPFIGEQSEGQKVNFPAADEYNHQTLKMKKQFDRIDRRIDRIDKIIIILIITN